MIHTNNLRIIEINNSYNKIQKFTSLFITICAVLGFIYFIYWAAVMTDDYILDYTSKYFSPLASFLFPNDETVNMYRSTSFVLFSLIVPAIMFYQVADRIRGFLLNCEYKNEEKIKLNQIKQKRINDLMQYEIINSYSICLTLDYESENKLKDESVLLLNRAAFNKIKESLAKKYSDINVSINEFLIVKSMNFDEYDSVYDTILKTLSKIKDIYETKYNFKVVPNIISDAYLHDESVQKISNYNKDIKKLNFKNRALSTALFSKKYKYLKHNKYAGIPIGEYALFNGSRMGTYELNIVYKNLSKTLTEMK